METVEQSRKPMQRVSVVILDLDNTLFDWVEIWYQSFHALLEGIVEKSGIDRDVLLADFKTVFTLHGTSEYAFAIQELACLQAKHPGENIAEIYDSAIHAYRSARKQALKLFPGVEETLQTLKDTGCLLVGYTESMAFYTHYRMRKLGLDRILDYIYSPQDHDLPPGMSADQIRLYSKDEYKLRRTTHRHTPKGELKPNPTILLQIIRDVAATPDEALYVGDSLMKDISMATEAKITNAWAKYGLAQNRPEYELLRKVTHWSSSSVEKERELSEKQVVPTVTLCDSLADLLPAFRFEPYIDRSPERIGRVIDAWKTTVAVQQHFNELEMKVRNFALTIAGAVLAGATFSIKEQVEFVFQGLHIPLATLILGAGIVVWCAFYLMDRHWYHNLLIGAVTHGLLIERRYREQIPELALATAIGAASPTVVNFGVTKKSRATLAYQWKIRSSTKLNLFYGVGIVLLIVAAFGSFWIVGKNPDRKTDTVVSTKTDSIDSPNENQDATKATSANKSRPTPTKIAPVTASDGQETGMQKSPLTNPPAAKSAPVVAPADDQKDTKPKANPAGSQ
jgi:phosphoglycolate phosphatase-like HAD superfamily hydrolase